MPYLGSMELGKGTTTFTFDVLQDPLQPIWEVAIDPYLVIATIGLGLGVTKRCGIFLGLVCPAANC